MTAMNAVGADFWSSTGSSRVKSRLKFRDTNWGFAVEVVSNSNGQKSVAETAFKAVGIGMLLMGGWIALPQMGFQVVDSMTRLGLSAAFVIIGFSLFTYASRGFVPELRIDTNRREVAIGTMSSRGLFTPRKTISAKDVQSFFLLRAKNNSPATLCARRRNGNTMVKIMSGTEADLVPVLERISEAFRPANAPGGRVKTRASGAFIHATFD